MKSIDLNEIVFICANYSGSGYYVEELIPRRKLSNFRKKLLVPDSEHVIAFLDAALFGSGKVGLVISNSGIHWRNDWTTETQKNFLKWEEFTQVDIKRNGSYDIELGLGNVFNMSGSSFDKDILVQLLQDIQNYIIDALKGEDEQIDYYKKDDISIPSIPMTSTEKWMVAIAGQLYGPFDLHLIKSLLSNVQIQPEEVHVWNLGVPVWVPFMQQPELVGLMIPAMLPAPLVPPVTPTSQSIADTIETVLNPKQAAYDLDHVNINTASLEELIESLGVGVVGAKRIIQYREEIGEFQSPEQVAELLELKPHQLERLRKRVIFIPLSSMELQSSSIEKVGTYEGGVLEHLSPSVLDLNSASESDISNLPGVGAILAKKAIQYHRRNNGFLSVDEFFEILGLKQYVIERIRPLVIVHSPSLTPPKPNSRVVDY